MALRRGRTFRFSSFEVLIVIGVTSAVLGFVLPAYNGVVDTMRMTKVSTHFDSAVASAQMAWHQDVPRVAMGMASSMPGSTEAWLSKLNKGAQDAPGGGPAYIAMDTDFTLAEMTDFPGSVTGAIGVRWTSKSPAAEARLDLWRPAYVSLVAQQATIRASSVDVRNLSQ